MWLESGISPLYVWFCRVVCAHGVFAGRGGELHQVGFRTPVVRIYTCIGCINISGRPVIQRDNALVILYDNGCKVRMDMSVICWQDAFIPECTHDVFVVCWEDVGIEFIFGVCGEERDAWT